MSTLALGIDSGGTFTDGVVLDLDSGTILCKAKVITDRSNLEKAIAECLEALAAAHPAFAEAVVPKVVMSCLSTTLATNAIVEGQGAEVGLLLIGREPEGELPTQHIALLPGGCDIQGRIREPLDIEATEEAIGRLQHTVDAFAVSGYMSVRNPEQELQVRDRVEELTGYPVVCGHQLSGDLGIYERSVTAVLNARLIPLIARLIDAVKRSLEARGIDCPLMVVKGDGGLISERVARERPIETILSGPAASLTGGGVLAGLSDALVVDMGGTTTDAALLHGGRPCISDRGAMVGGWRTHVKAADVTTVGLGGDSIIRAGREGSVEIGPQRVFPLCWSVSRFPHLLAELEAVWRERFDPQRAQPTCILFFIGEPEKASLKAAERELLDQIRGKPHTLHTLCRRLGREESLLPWQHLVEIGSVHRSNLTPTDLLHAQGRFLRWDRRAAELGLRIMARHLKRGPERLLQAVYAELGYRLFALLIQKLLANDGVELGFDGEDPGSFLLRRMFAPAGESVDFAARAKVPLVAVGAPAATFFPPLADRLAAELVLPEHGEVANAVGTVHGSVRERVKVLIRPGESGGYYVYGPEGRKLYIDFEEALSYGESAGENTARSRARKAGGHDIEVAVARRDSYSSFDDADDASQADRLFIECTLEVVASGRAYKNEEEV